MLGLLPLLSLLSLKTGGASDDEEEEEDEGDPEKGQNSLQARLRRFNNDAMALAADQHQELYRMRRKVARLRTQAKDAPAEGSVVLTKDEAAVWQALKALGTPDEIRAALTERDSLKAAAAERDKAEHIAKVAKAANLNADVLQRLPGVDDVTFEITEVEGQEPQVHAKKKDGDRKALAEFIEAEWKVFEPALKATGGADQQQQSRDGNSWVRQGSGAGNGTQQQGNTPVAIAGQMLSQRYKFPGKEKGDRANG